MNPSRVAEDVIRLPIVVAAAESDDEARTESFSEDSEEAQPSIWLLDRSSLDLAMKHWNAELQPLGVAAQNEPNADAFSRFLWRLDVAIEMVGRGARPSVVPWLRTLANDARAREECFRLAAEEEKDSQCTIAEVYNDMRGVQQEKKN